MEFKKSYNDYMNTEERIVEFIQEIEKKAKDYDVIILTTRRCFCLISCAQRKFEKLSLATLEKLISSQAIDIYGEKFANKKVLLVDDIMIHGRAIYNLNEKVKNYHALKTDTFVLCKNLEFPDFYKYATGADYESMFLLSNSDWKSISNDILDFFESEHQIYTSYMFSLRDINSNPNYLYKSSFDNFTDIVPEYVRKRSYKTNYYFYKNTKLTKYNCLREYSYFDENKDTIYVPYCELKDFTFESLEISWKKLLNELKTDYNSQLYNFYAKDIYKAYTVIISLFDYDLNKITSDEINQSYYKNFLSDIIVLIERLKNIKPTLEEVSDFIIDCGLIECDEQLFFDAASFYSLETEIKSEEAMEWFSHYITRISAQEEKAYKENIEVNILNKEDLIYKQNLNNGKIPFSNIIDSIQFASEKAYFTFISFVIFLMDVGCVSQVVEEFKNTNKDRIITTAIKTGEQSYKIPYTKNPMAFFIAAKFYDYFTFCYGRKLTEVDIDNYISHLNELISKYMNENNISFKNSLLSGIKEFLTLKKDGCLYNMMDTYKALINSEHFDEINYILQDLPNYF